jgi:hypothetical protein
LWQLRGHDVRTVVGQGWAGLKNGEVLRRAASDFDVFVTMDGNIEFQQHIDALSFGVVLVRAQSNRMLHLRPLVAALLEAITVAKPGRLQRVGA